MKKEIVFSIHPAENCKAFLVHIDEVEIKDHQASWPSTRKKIYREVLLNSPHKEAVKILMEEKARALRASGRRESIDTVDFSEIVIEGNRSYPLLKALAASGQLYFKRKPLMTNLFKGVEVLYHLEGNSVRATFTSKRGVFDLTACALLVQGSPPWLIHNEFLEIIQEDVSWKWVRKAFEERPLQVSVDEVEELIELEGARVNGSREVVKSSEPLPVLRLTDKTGAFANLQGESWKNDLVEAGYQEKQVGSSAFYCPVDKAADALLLLIEVGWEVRDSLGSLLVAANGMEMSAAAAGEFVWIKGKMLFGTHQATISDVAKALKKQEPFIQLAPGYTGLITKEKCGGIPEGEIYSEGIKIPRHDLVTLKDAYEKGVKFEGDLLGLVSTPAAISTGRDFRGTLRSYQQEGLAWLSHLHQRGLHGILADDMGLGKTVQVIAFLSTLELKHPVLIVMPRSLLFNWQQELKRFTPALSTYLHHGGSRAQSVEEWTTHQVILTSYSILRGDLALFQQVRFSCIFLDEAHAIKNVQSQTAQAVSGLKGDFRISITGTPIENHLGELTAQFNFLIPGLFKDAVHHPALIKKKARPFILRRKKQDVDEQLPEKIEQTIWLTMDPGQKEIYNGFLTRFRQGLFKKVAAEGLGKHRMEVFEAILRLRQICCHPLLINGVEEGSSQSIKLDALLNDLETILEEGQKALVYSQFTSMLSLIKKGCVERGWKFAYLDGATKDREGAVHQFQNDPETQLFLISLKAGGVGLNLTAADYVFLFDPWWNEAVENQAIDRAHRIGRHHTVIAKRYILKDTIEEKMMLLKASKKNLADDLFEGESSLSQEDLEFLLY